MSFFDDVKDDEWRVTLAEFVTYPCGNASRRRGRTNVKLALKWERDGRSRSDTWYGHAEAVPEFMKKWAKLAGIALNSKPFFAK